ncbi:MAG TPA: hypothetical protein VL860_11805, partial [Planctomycetota bacterium]|nr:hypothetical protein [Planctomycetota bacterium]
KPDMGLLLADFLACWLLGIFFVALGVVASTFSENLTIGFVCGALLCLVFIGAEVVGDKLASANYFGAPVLQNLSATRHFTLMTKGMLTMEDLFYFAGGTVVVLYLNLVILSKRLWA